MKSAPSPSLLFLLYHCPLFLHPAHKKKGKGEIGGLKMYKYIIFTTDQKCTSTFSPQTENVQVHFHQCYISTALKHLLILCTREKEGTENRNQLVGDTNCHMIFHDKTKNTPQSKHQNLPHKTNITTLASSSSPAIPHHQTTHHATTQRRHVRGLQRHHQLPLQQRL